MIKALLLIVQPAVTWDGISRAQRNIGFVLLTFLLPLLALTALGEGYGWVHWGKWRELGGLRRLPLGETLVVQAAQVLVSLLVVFVGGNMVKAVGETFRARPNYTQTFGLVAYALGPVFLFRLLDAFAGMSPWVGWAIGICLSLAALYHGVPRIMEPDPAHAFGLYLISALLMVLFTGVLQFLVDAYLHGRFVKLQALVSDLASHLPF
jgi:hypothetical protein